MTSSSSSSEISMTSPRISAWRRRSSAASSASSVRSTATLSESRSLNPTSPFRTFPFVRSGVTWCLPVCAVSPGWVELVKSARIVSLGEPPAAARASAASVDWSRALAPWRRGSPAAWISVLRLSTLTRRSTLMS